MITALHTASYVAAIAGFLFITLSLASGLLWIAEVIEEHTKLAKVVGRRSVYAIIAFHLILLVVDKLPALLIFFSIFCHLVYLQNFSKTWPLISLSSPSFIASCLLVLVDHLVWFYYFSEHVKPVNQGGLGVSGGYHRPTYSNTSGMRGYGKEGLGFMDVVTFFGICVWFMPLYLFLSLSANDNALPSFGTSQAPTTSQNDLQSGRSIGKTILTPFSILFSTLSLSRSSSSRSTEGLLAPSAPSGPYTPSANQQSVYSPWGERAPTSLPSSPMRAPMFKSPPPQSPSRMTPGGSSSLIGRNAFREELENSNARNINLLSLTPPNAPRRAVSDHGVFKSESSPRGGLGTTAEVSLEGGAIGRKSGKGGKDD
ncbi:Predicted mitochondrial cholesterol transporter [Phaffia rhodozyma]|uniref:Predicted mitochondrial cholesterol transporter n=1 Tax=Phaffia rhodozyma TaxID=264483 RepID=A0A0F7SPW8_PHARH|nr:Predicted mitochondrial cholesterol transporter [Phaffia rhodozyma]